jgi:hypothetical protein
LFMQESTGHNAAMRRLLGWSSAVVLATPLALGIMAPAAPTHTALPSFVAFEGVFPSGNDDSRGRPLTEAGEPIGDHPLVDALYGKLALSFEANEGQADSSADFVAHGSGYTLLLSAGDAMLSLPQPRAPSAAVSTLEQPPSVLRLQLKLEGADQHPQGSGEDVLPGTVNYFGGNDPSQWRTGIPTYAQVRYQEVYPGVDLVLYGRQGQLEYDFVVDPGIDPRLIRLGFVGAEQVELDAAGDVVLHVPGGQLRQAAPVIYQDGPEGRQKVAGGYALDDVGNLGFAVGAYDPTRPLIIDPILTYSTFLGGSETDTGFGITVDPAGNAYVTGAAVSANFPTTPGAFHQTFDGRGEAMFVAKLNAAGTALVYSTFIGGTGIEFGGRAIAVDAAGDAYVTGTSSSDDFPTTTGALHRTRSGPNDAFVIKLNPTGTALVYSTFLGGTGAGLGIALDSASNAYIVGNAGSDFPTTPGAFLRTFGFGATFVAKLNPTGTALVYSTFLRGSRSNTDVGDFGNGIAVDAADNAYVTGAAGSADFPTTPGALQRTCRNCVDGGTDAFVTKVNSTGTALVYSTFLGGSSFDHGDSITLDTDGNAYITGDTGSSDFPTTPGAVQRTFFGGDRDAFAAKLNSTGTKLVYSTLLGGSNSQDTGQGIAVDKAGNAYITGFASGANFPTTLGAIRRSSSGTFVAKLSSTGTSLVYSTLLAGFGSSIAVDAVGNAYVTGSAGADFLTTPGAFQPIPGGARRNAFVAKIAPGPPTCQMAALLPGPPAQLRVLVHADRGLASLAITEATNVIVALPTFAPGSTDTLQVTATKLNQSAKAVVALQATDQAGSSITCDPAMVTIGHGPNLTPVQLLTAVPANESQVTISNGAPGVDRMQLLVNGRRFQLRDLHDDETRRVDVSSAMRRGSGNTILVAGHGSRSSTAVVMVSDP